MSYVQYNGDFEEVESKYRSLTLWADGDNKVYYEEDGVRNYLEVGDYVVLEGSSHVVSKQKPEEAKATKKAEPKEVAPKKAAASEPAPAPGNGGPNNETTEMKPGQGSATTDDRV